MLMVTTLSPCVSSVAWAKGPRIVTSSVSCSHSFPVSTRFLWSISNTLFMLSLPSLMIDRTCRNVEFHLVALLVGTDALLPKAFSNDSFNLVLLWRLLLIWVHLVMTWLIFASFKPSPMVNCKLCVKHDSLTFLPGNRSIASSTMASLSIQMSGSSTSVLGSCSGSPKIVNHDHTYNILSPSIKSPHSHGWDDVWSRNFTFYWDYQIKHICYKPNNNCTKLRSNYYSGIRYIYRPHQSVENRH